MSSVRLRNTNPLGLVDLPLIGRQGDDERPGFGSLKPGEEFDVPAEVAGCAPGSWRLPTDDEAAEGLRGLTTRVVAEGTEDEHVEVLCPGKGLLAQVGNFELVKTRRPATAPTAQES